MFTPGNTRSAKLSNEQVYEMRREYEAGATQSYLSRKYGIAVNTVGRIVRGESRQRVPTPTQTEDHIAAQERLLELQRTQGGGILEKVLAKAQRVLDKERPERDLEKFIVKGD